MPLIAVDGPAASGKGTIARALGRHFGVPHLDTGALYRAVALAAMRAGLALDDGKAMGAQAMALDLSLLEDPELRGAAAGEAASRVSALPEVRAALLAFQKAFAAQPGGAVLDGRDIGTVIAPEAQAKLFVTATAETRARRRFLELTSAGRDVAEERVLADIVARDARDMGRADAPLRQAADADLLDTSDLDIAAAVRQAVELVSRRLDRIS
ncbi:(d)CMP kinase [Sandaracinobacter sp. RS1-74]|uniref:(d)CMP kinase n=1 Tax=Sandaracinobacteroides sayramensis TaxID=2913411 RepID=UPI001EDC4772|nr:(d)CMP kinase [Sandaracinobacteroides sayramensis]MCG2841426.1 (d)CMP kinase [Sandaracinobacteroides sayramensis]